MRLLIIPLLEGVSSPERSCGMHPFEEAISGSYIPRRLLARLKPSFCEEDCSDKCGRSNLSTLEILTLFNQTSVQVQMALVVLPDYLYWNWMGGNTLKLNQSKMEWLFVYQVLQQH